MQKPDLMASANGPAPLAMTAIVPIKPFGAAKSRLEQMAPDARAVLAARMATLTLDALADSACIERVLVVSEGVDIAALATARGFPLVPDPGEGLNAAYAAGLAAARAGGAEHVLLLHADFLTVDSRAITELVSSYTRLGRETAAALVPCKEGSGTNAVLLPPGMAFTPMFGTGSLARHRAQLGQSALILESAALAQDIDQLSDLDGAMEQILRRARALRDASFGDIVTYSPKLFLPLTQMCRDVCHYCTFAKTPGHLAQPFIPVAEAVEQARAGLAQGCKEALLTLGEKPELRYAAARQWLDAHGYGSTLDYVADVARALRDEAGILPHINAGCMNAGELAMLRPVCASMGLMLESTSPRLCEKGGPHYGSPDKDPGARLATLEEAGRQSIPFTTGLLIGIGETRAERIETLAAIRRLHERYGHIQEVIVQNFLPKPDTKMADHPPAPLEELVWTIAMARVMLGPEISIQAPPNLNAGQLEALVNAGINDWGGVSPLTPDFVNPEAPWPEIAELAQATARAGKVLAPRLTIYPAWLADSARWLDPAMRAPVLRLADGAGLAREDGWVSGRSQHVPTGFADHFAVSGKSRIEWLADDYEIDIPLDKGKAEVLLTISSIEMMKYPDSVVAMAKLFNAAGVDWTFSTKGYEATNFGYLAGRADIARAMVERIVAAAEETGAKTVVIPECGHAYGLLRWGGGNIHGAKLPFEVWHITEYLAKLKREGKLKFKPIEGKVTYHDPCQVSRRGGAKDDARYLLESFKEFREMEPTGNYNWCCGGGGGVQAIQRSAELRHKVFRIKMDQVEQSGADALVSSCANCRLTMDESKAHFKWDHDLVSIVEALADHIDGVEGDD